MYHLGLLLVVVLGCWASVPEQELFLRNAYPIWKPLPIRGEPGSKLILTPYIESGDIVLAQNLSAVHGGPFDDVNIPSYSGFFTVNKKYNSNLFFWYFPAEENPGNAPVVLWLQGGPGSSSLFGLFTELGPFFVAKDEKNLDPNPCSWHKKHNLIFIDNPVGTGFSFTDYDEGYATEQVQVGEELYSAMLQFFKMFPELQKVPFFITGESYAGKYVPALGYTIHNKNPTADLKINLKGLAVGNGFTDPITILAYSHFVYQLGLVDTTVYKTMMNLEELGKEDIKAGNLVSAFQKWNQDLAAFQINADFSNLYNFLYKTQPQVGGNYFTFVQREEVRRALHVGDAEYTSTGIVYSKMIPDFLNSVRPWLEFLLDKYPVLYYNGQMDIIVAYALSVNMFNELKFGAAEEYHNATRQSWYVGDQLAGYSKKAGMFTEVLVRNAGHMVPTDQPEWAFDLINRFTSGQGLPTTPQVPSAMKTT